MQTRNHDSSLLIFLSIFHIATIAVSIYLGKMPIQLFGIYTTLGAFIYPFIFLATDLTVRLFGPILARKIIFVVMLPGLLIAYLVSVLFAHGSFSGFESLMTPNAFVARVVTASFVAYLVGQMLDIKVFNRLRQRAAWWVAPSCSTVAGSLIDTLIFFSLAFIHSSNPVMAAHWVEMAFVDYINKLVINGLFFLPMYGALLNLLANRLRLPVYRGAR